MEKRIKLSPYLSTLLSGFVLLSTIASHANTSDAERVGPIIGVDLGVDTIVTLPDGTYGVVREGAAAVLPHIGGESPVGATVVADSKGGFSFAAAGLFQSPGASAPTVPGTDIVSEGTSLKRRLLIGAGVIALGIAYWYKNEILKFLGLKSADVSKEDSSFQDDSDPDQAEKPEVDEEMVATASESV